MKIEIYSFKRKAEESKKKKIEKDRETHWLIVFPEIKKSYCSECLYECCMHGQSFINKNVASIFMENMDFEPRYNFEFDINEDKAYDIGMNLMFLFHSNSRIKKERIENVILENS